MPQACIAPAVSDQRYRFQQGDWIYLAGSIVFQLIVGTLLGHIYDQRIFMSTGYLVGTGHGPYAPLDLTAVFQNPYFQNYTTIGYPPPWPLMTGLIYRLTYAIFPNFLLYNLALKIPIILSNIGLAFLTANVVQRLTQDSWKSHRAWRFMLINPLLIYTTAAWGQMDSVVALLSLAALVLLDAGQVNVSAILLALAITTKPTALPLALIPFFFLKMQSWRLVGRYYAILLSGILFISIAPFWIFGWDPSPILQHWNAHFTVGGGMSYLAFIEPLRGNYQLDGWWWSLGLLWLPALARTGFQLRRGIQGLPDLLSKSTAVILVFFLTRSWLSEQNIILVLPFVLILTVALGMDQRMLTAIWLLPLVFSVFNTAPAQLLFPTFPAVMEKLLRMADQVREVRLIAKVVIVIPWLVVGWRLVIWGLKHPNNVLTSPAAQPAAGNAYN